MPRTSSRRRVLIAHARAGVMTHGCSQLCTAVLRPLDRAVYTRVYVQFVHARPCVRPRVRVYLGTHARSEPRLLRYSCSTCTRRVDLPSSLIRVKFNNNTRILQLYHGVLQL
jgi:hypothetical protein